MFIYSFDINFILWNWYFWFFVAETKKKLPNRNPPQITSTIETSQTFDPYLAIDLMTSVGKRNEVIPPIPWRIHVLMGLVLFTYIYLHENHKNQRNVGKYTIQYMDGMGMLLKLRSSFLRSKLMRSNQWFVGWFVGSLLWFFETSEASRNHSSLWKSILIDDFLNVFCFFRKDDIVF